VNMKVELVIGWVFTKKIESRDSFLLQGLARPFSLSLSLSLSLLLHYVWRISMLVILLGWLDEMRSATEF
jgi:hypothetical protein